MNWLYSTIGVTITGHVGLTKFLTLGVHNQLIRRHIVDCAFENNFALSIVFLIDST